MRVGQIDDAEVFGEGGEAGAEGAGGVADEAAAVEDELVVAADGVDVDDGAAEGAGGVGDEGLADVAFVVVPGARGEVDHEVAFLGRELAGGIDAAIELTRAEGGVRPDIFADGDANAAAGVFDDERAGGGFEVAVFVEDIVGRQEALVGGGDDLAAMNEGGGVERGPAGAGGVSLDRADERGDVADVRGDFAEGVFAIGNEAAFEEQVARRVAADDELGEDDEFGALGDEDVVGVEDLAAIAGKVADGGVELGEAESHGKGGKSETVKGIAGEDNSAREIGLADGRRNMRGWRFTMGGPP